jgi:hypothetical protein
MLRRKRLISPARKKYLFWWVNRVIQHFLSPRLMVRRLSSPVQSIRLLLSPISDRKLAPIRAADQNQMLAHAFRTLVEFRTQGAAIIQIDEFAEYFKITVLDTASSKSLGELLAESGSDKQRNNYHKFYELILINLLTKTEGAVNLFEIGLGSNNIDTLSNMGIHGTPGASLRAFRDFSQRIHVVGADIDRRVMFSEERIRTFFVNQLEKNSLLDMAEIVENSDLVIDDGLHNAEANLNVVLSYRDLMKSGSWLVVEDIAKEEFSLKLWLLIQALMPEFKSAVLDFPKSYVFVAQKQNVP